MQTVHQVVFTDVLIVGQLNTYGQSFAPIGLHEIDTFSDWLLIKRHCIIMKGLLINRITAAIGVILAFTGKKMFLFSTKIQRGLRKIQKPAGALIKANI